MHTEVTMNEGRVACPYLEQGATVDVETCYRCSNLRAFHDEESGTTVECTYHPHVLGKTFASVAHLADHLRLHHHGH